MRLDADILVVGAGVAGLATARALAREGRRVVAVEQFDVGHERGSSHGSSRIFRLSYDDERYVRLAQNALDGWRQLEAECADELVVHVGAVDIGPRAAGIERALAGCGVRFEALSGREAAARWPLLIQPDEHVLFQPDGGYLRADRACSALLASARAAGATVLERTAVISLETIPGAVEIATTAGGLIVKAVVVTAGAWAQPLLAPLGIELPVVPTRETVSYFELALADELPSVIDTLVPDAADYGLVRPGQASYGLAAPGVGLKAGLHHAGAVADPDDVGQPETGIIRWTAEWVGRRYPDANVSPRGLDTCVYTNTADERFVLERHGRVVVGSACSGHGFKFAPSIGRTLAALASEAVG